MGWVMKSERELNPVEMLAQVDDGRLNVDNAANMLALTRRQIFRLLKRYRQDGASAIRHKSRRRAPNNQIHAAKRDYALTLIKEQYPEILVIMITAFHDMESTIEAMQRGADDYIHKPIDIDEPVDLNTWFGESRDRDVTQLVLDPCATANFAAEPPPETKLCFLVGPEGGLSEKELGDADAAGFRGVRPGPRILRTETVVLSGMTPFACIYGDLV